MAGAQRLAERPSGAERTAPTQWVRVRDTLWHTEDPTTVASFRTWRGLRVSVAQGPNSVMCCARRCDTTADTGLSELRPTQVTDSPDRLPVSQAICHR